MDELPSRLTNIVENTMQQLKRMGYILYTKIKRPLRYYIKFKGNIEELYL